MTLKLYLNSSPDNVVNKNISLLTTATDTEGLAIQPTESFSLLNPVIIVDYDETYLKANYCYIDTYNRYYYINNMVVQTGGCLTIYCSVDVLMTYKDVVLNVQAVVTRNEGIGSPTFVVDESLPVHTNKIYLKEIQFPNQPFNNEDDWDYVVGVRT